MRSSPSIRAPGVDKTAGKRGGTETPEEEEEQEERANDNEIKKASSGNRAGWKIEGTHWTQKEGPLKKHDSEGEKQTEHEDRKDASNGKMCD